MMHYTVELEYWNKHGLRPDGSKGRFDNVDRIWSGNNYEDAQDAVESYLKGMPRDRTFAVGRYRFRIEELVATHDMGLDKGYEDEVKEVWSEEYEITREIKALK